LLITLFVYQLPGAGKQKTHDRFQPWVLVEIFAYARQDATAPPTTTTTSVTCRTTMFIVARKVATGVSRVKYAFAKAFAEIALHSYKALCRCGGVGRQH
jgi:hypothetical protein